MMTLDEGLAGRGVQCLKGSNRVERKDRLSRNTGHFNTFPSNPDSREGTLGQQT